MKVTGYVNGENRNPNAEEIKIMQRRLMEVIGANKYNAEIKFNATA